MKGLFKFNYQVVIFLICALLLPLSGFKITQKKSAEELVLRDVPMKNKPSGFYVAAVFDNRDNKSSFGKVIPLQAVQSLKGITIQTQDLQMANGIGAIMQYLKRNIPYDKDRRPVNISFKKLLVTESLLPDGRIDGKVDLSLSFDLKTGEDLAVPLTKYSTTAHYTRLANQTGVNELLIRQSLESAVNYLDKWIVVQSDNHPALAKKVKLVFTDYSESPENDTVYYSAKRQLTWDDFRDKPHTGKYAAEVLPGLGYNEQTYINKGVIYVNIGLKVYLPKSACWVAASSMNNYTLNHEQRHFDIVKIISEQFKQKLLSESLPVFNYDGWISAEYFETLHQMDVFQKKYDSETSHGINVSEQERWNIFIDKQLSAYQNLSGGS
ncbi:hypothetical protein [Mucilaginibacter sp. KACC 22063]|uniref:hypothetical protein n=1 Tax=Mucilaginibacter sp. KACC 22063 TaxID=3025666 RepID=UPI002365D29D|nr:hypothetical protein [Mucilaginibacter sp. KACC 22063]WDF54508.1 hypothetical protein PQ461_16355 [Mucilaginibacter sp. KACC 22063]